jgi:hypothetical protein
MSATAGVEAWPYRRDGRRPGRQPLPAAGAAGGSVLNGAGEVTGLHSAREWG